MAQLIAAFNAHQFDPSQGGGSLPVGRHPVVIIESEVKGTSANDGGLLELTLRIIDGPAAGTTGPYRLNLYNKSEKAVEIAHKQMSAICHVIGVYNVTETQAMHNLPFLIEVGMQKGEEAAAKGYTEVKKVFDINGNEPGKAGAGQQAAQPAQQQQAQQQQQPAQGGGWGQQPPQPQQQQGQPPAQGAAWGQGGQPLQQQQAQAQPAASGWQQSAPAGGKPAWG